MNGTNFGALLPGGSMMGYYEQLAKMGALSSSLFKKLGAFKLGRVGGPIGREAHPQALPLRSQPHSLLRQAVGVVAPHLVPRLERSFSPPL
jgi:hypothetical protein